jgi:pimeloyl-ACP methyl ester carboxylesterase
MPDPTPFTIALPQARLDSIRARVEAFDWDAVPDAGGWRAGVGTADLRRLVDHWLHRYNWRAQEAALNALPQFTTTLGEQRLHFVRARGDGSRPPVLLLHGWPGSFIEFARLVEPLTRDGHDVVVPSLPGFGFSGRPARPTGPRAAAALMHGLMTAVLGYSRFIVQGGDWGAALGAWLAHDHAEAVIGLHLNMVLVQAADAAPATPEERAWADRRAALAQEEGGYSLQQGTRPQTLGFAMSDSPVGTAAWILEKFGVWSDVPKRADGSPDLWAAFDEDLLLTNIMLYVTTGAFPSSTWIYKGRRQEGSATFPAGARVRVPTGIAAFPDPAFPPPPRSQAEKSYNLLRWTDMPRGGHFAALEQPDLWLADLRGFVGQL